MSFLPTVLACALSAALLGTACDSTEDLGDDGGARHDAQAGAAGATGAGSDGGGVDAGASSGAAQMDRDASGSSADSAVAEPGAAVDASGGGADGSADTGHSDGGGTSPDALPGADDLIVAPNGEDGAAGTLAAPTTLTAALTRIGAGHAIYMRGGSYAHAAQVTIERDNSGRSAQLKTLAAYPGERPVLDFSSQPYGASSNPRGLQINGDYWHIVGLTVTGSADNGVYIAGGHNVLESCIVHGNHDTGVQLGRYGSSATQAEWPSDNLILNCESYDNYDAPPGSGENADGFAAKLTVGPGNVFRGCISHHNIDDGWDLFTKTDTGAIGPVTIDQCIAHHNGTLTDGTTNANGDRNGFKLGGESIAVAHVVTRSVAFANGKDGFTWNSNPGAIRLSNTLSLDNGASNYRFGDNATPTQAVFTNNLSFRTASGGQSDKALGQNVGDDVANSNCFSPNTNGKGLTVTGTDFARSLAKPAVARSADGSIDFAPFALAADSDLVNAGVVPAGTLPFDASMYYHDRPDLGAVEVR